MGGGRQLLLVGTSFQLVLIHPQCGDKILTCLFRKLETCGHDESSTRVATKNHSPHGYDKPYHLASRPVVTPCMKTLPLVLIEVVPAVTS